MNVSIYLSVYLSSLPIVSEPFCQIAIDIVGPLPVCKDSDNRYIFTVLDLCTHYPEAIPLKQHTAQDVAQALVNVLVTLVSHKKSCPTKGVTSCLP